MDLNKLLLKFTSSKVNLEYISNAAKVNQPFNTIKLSSL